MKQFAFWLVLLSTSLFGHFAAAQGASDIEGFWLTDDGESHVHIYREGNTYRGKIAWLKNPNDENGRPITDDRGDEILGMEFMKGFIYDGGEYTEGRVYDPESGKTYYGSMRLDGDNKLKLRGSLDKSGWLGRTETWTRVEK